MTQKRNWFVAVLMITCAALSAQVGFKLNTGNTLIDTANSDSTKIYRDGDSVDVYKTVTIIRYQYSVARMEQLQPKVKELMNELNRNSQQPGNLFPPDVVNRKLDSVDVLNKEIAVMKHEQDSLYAAYITEYVDFRTCTFFPGVLRARSVFDVVYGTGGERFKAMGNSGVQFGANGTASIYSEIVSGNLGLIRVGFGTMLTSDDSGNDSIAENDQAYQRLVTNGGNTILSLEYPLLYVNGYHNQLNAIVRPIVKGTADLPAFGTSTDKWAGSMMFGLDAYADAALDNNQLRFFANASTFYIRGTSIYQSNLAITAPDFSFGQLTLGLVFLENFKVSIIVATWSTQAILRNRNVVIGGQVLR